MDPVDQRIERIAERVLSAKFGFWSAMLTTHTVFLSVAVALLATNLEVVRGAFKAVGCVAALGILGMVLNFALTKSQYQTMGVTLMGASNEPSDARREGELRFAIWRWRLTQACELASALAIGIEVAILGWILCRL
jgi:hypothetical protein